MTSFCVCKRARLLDNTERLERSSHKLEQGYRIAVETGKDINPPPSLPLFFLLFMCVHVCQNHSALVRGGRTQELCESRGGCPGLLVPKSHCGLCVRKAIFEEEEVRRGSPVLDQMMHQVRL